MLLFFFFKGLMLMEGTVVKDENRALSMLHRSCDDGEFESCFYLGKQYLNGMNGVASNRSPVKAEDTLKKACDGGHAPSCRLLAVMYRNGDTGVAPDVAKFEEYKRRTHELVIQRGASAGLQVT
jgi:uncharacterized protein